MISIVICKRNNLPLTTEDILKANSTETYMKLQRRVMQYINVYCTDYIWHNMVFCWGILLDILMQIFIMLRQLVAEISRFKFDDCRVIHTGTSDIKLFVGGVHV